MKRLDDCPFLDRDQWDFQACPAEETYEARSDEYAPNQMLGYSRSTGGGAMPPNKVSKGIWRCTETQKLLNRLGSCWAAISM